AMAAWWVRIDLLQNYFAIRNVCLRRWQIILTGFSAESQSYQSQILAGNDQSRLCEKSFASFFARVCHACETTELKNSRLASQSKQPFLFEFFDNAVVDQILGLEAAEFFIGKSQYADAVADAFYVGI